MPKHTPSSPSPKSFLVQAYFVLAALLGLLLMVLSGVSVSRLALNTLLGVKDYPDFAAPYPVKDQNIVDANAEGLSDAQKEKIAEWEVQYDDWMVKQKEFNSQDQNRRRQIAESLAMFVIGLPVFLLHFPYVWGKREG